MAAFPQKTVPVVSFAKVMQDAGGSLAESVKHFASRFGTVHEELLAVLTQAALFCWVNVEAPSNLFAVCEAIRTGSPVRHYYHCQVTPGRWNEMHAYLAGIQRWLGIELPLPIGSAL